MARLTTEWATDDPVLAIRLRQIQSEPEGTAVRCELEAVLHMAQARLCWQEAERLRAQGR